MMNQRSLRIGVLVPFTNTNLEADLQQFAPAGVTLHYARLGGYDADEVPDGDQMAGLGSADIDEPLRLLAGVRPHVVLYGCTSATLSHGKDFDRTLAQKIEAAMGVPTVTAAGAVVRALGLIGARRIAFASPYVKSLNDRAIAFLADAGFETVSRADWPEDLGNYGQGALTPADVKSLARQADADTADAIVLSCTDLRSTETVADIEAELHKPVITSNAAMLHAALALMDIDGTEVRAGRLFQQ